MNNRPQLKIITTSSNLPSEHARIVNEFLQSNIEIIEIENSIIRTPNARRCDAEIMTVITYK